MAAMHKNTGRAAAPRTMTGTVGCQRREHPLITARRPAVISSPFCSVHDVTAPRGFPRGVDTLSEPLSTPLSEPLSTPLPGANSFVAAAFRDPQLVRIRSAPTCLRRKTLLAGNSCSGLQIAA